MTTRTATDFTKPTRREPMVTLQSNDRNRLLRLYADETCIDAPLLKVEVAQTSVDLDGRPKDTIRESLRLNLSMAGVLLEELTRYVKTHKQPSPYPEHDKLSDVKDETQAVGEFFDWLQSTDDDHDRLVLGELIDRDEFLPWHGDVRVLLAQWKGIDQKKLEAEKEQMLEELREGVRKAGRQSRAINATEIEL